MRLFHKFFDLKKYNAEKNIDMSIEDKEKNDLFASKIYLKILRHLMMLLVCNE